MMKNSTLIPVIFCVFFLKLNSFSSEPVIPVKDTKQISTSSLSKLFPEDTVLRFINNLGKDSLIKLINHHITIAQQYLIENTDKLNYDNSLMEYILFAKHFNLKINLKSIDTSKLRGSQYRLYDLDYGDTKEPMQIIDNMKANGTNMLETLKTQTIDIIRYSVPFYCEKLTLDREIFEMIYSNSKKLKLNEQIEDYWKFTEINRKCKDEINGSEKYQEKLFEELFEKNNPKAYYIDTLPKYVVNDSANSESISDDKISTHEIELFQKKIMAYKMLAYALYADDINLSSFSDNLIYLLDAQQENGTWSMAKKFSYFNNSVTATLYGLWSLCEFREKLKKW